MINWLKKNRATFLEDWYGQNSLAFFIIVCLLYFGAYMIKRMFILDGIAAFEILQDRGEVWVMDLIFGLQYLSIPIFLAWKFTIAAFLLWTGCFMFGYRVTYAQLWKMVMVMELIFIVPELLKVIWFTLFVADPSYQDFTAFYPLSLINLVNYESLDPRWIYPLKAVNIFEIVYWGLLIAGVYWLSNKKLKISVLIVTSSYTLFFLLWLVYFLLAYR